MVPTAAMSDVQQRLLEQGKCLCPRQAQKVVQSKEQLSDGCWLAQAIVPVTQPFKMQIKVTWRGLVPEA